jgi:hypothetical protein
MPGSGRRAALAVVAGDDSAVVNAAIMAARLIPLDIDWVI